MQVDDVDTEFGAHPTDEQEIGIDLPPDVVLAPTQAKRPLLPRLVPKPRDDVWFIEFLGQYRRLPLVEGERRLSRRICEEVALPFGLAAREVGDARQMDSDDRRIRCLSPGPPQKWNAGRWFRPAS